MLKFSYFRNVPSFQLKLLKGFRTSSKLMAVRRMNVVEFSQILNSSQVSNYQIVDVREPKELKISKINSEKIVNLPLSEVDEWEEKLPDILNKDLPILCLCHHGGRSMQFASYLDLAGYKTFNVEGGIHEYSAQVDKSIPQY